MKEDMYEGMHHGGKSHLIILIGVLALLYGVGNYIRVTYLSDWPPYSTWMIGGVLLILIGWMKKQYFMNKKE